MQGSGSEITILSTTETDEQGMPADAALEQVESLGGSTLLGRQPVGGMGFTASFKDSEANTMGMWQNA